uniref:Synaptobrevin isoform A n=1 Tax=Lymnaea stagnalis TaxID=6523 RepID=Q869G4_LYMST|nr:synaptobrevin isoform A [Lymnaea stagnalis]
MAASQNPQAGPGGPPSAGPGGPGMQPPREQSKRLQQTQAQVDEVVDIMRVNVEKVLDRDQKISQLDDRAEALQAGASQFEASAGKLKRKYWWKNCKMMLILGAIIGIICIIIIVWVVTSTKGGDDKPTPQPAISSTTGTPSPKTT